MLHEDELDQVLVLDRRALLVEKLSSVDCFQRPYDLHLWLDIVGQLLQGD